MKSPSKDEIVALIRLTANAYGIDPDLSVRQCETESSFRVNAINPKSGCIGLFQVSARTAEGDLGIKNAKRALLDWRVNINAGLRYMQMLLKRYRGDYAKAYAAYNWGMGNLARCLKEHGDDWRSHLPAETRRYLEKILRDEVEKIA